MTVASPSVVLTPDVQASLTNLCATFQQTIAGSKNAIQQAALSSRENQQRAVQQMQETLRKSLQHLAQSSRGSVESYQNALKEALLSLNTRLASLTPDQRATLIDELSNERLQTVTRDYLDWLVSQSEEEPKKTVVAEITGTVTLSADDAPAPIDPTEAFREEYGQLSPTTQEIVEETSRLKTLFFNKVFLLGVFTSWMNTDIFEIQLLGFLCSLALGVAVALYNKPDSSKSDKNSQVS